MKILLVSWMLLLFGVSLNSGHYIRKVEDADSEVYRDTEDRSGVRFVDPKPEPPTARENLYYHIVEPPHGKQDPANSITERSFTNSHGLQFLKDTDDASSETEQIYDEHDVEYKEIDDTEHEGQEHENKLEDEMQNEREEQKEETEQFTEAKPLTEEDVKEAYKQRSYLYDQLRQRYSPGNRMILPETSSRRKREAYLEEIPNAPELPDTPPKDAYMQPNTYGMNLNSDGGYVWNNLNNPTVYYEVGQSTENPNQAQGQSESGQSQETQPPAETTPQNIPQVTENSDSGSSGDIYVSTDRQPATPSENQGVIEEKPENESEVVEESEEPVYNPDEKLESTEASERPIEPVVNDESVPDDYNPGVEKPEFEKPEEPGEPLEKPADSGLDTVGRSTESSEGEQAKVIPEAPTLPPLNFDNLPDYIRDAISSTEKSGSHEHTDNPFINPQLDPEDKKKLEEKMENIFATAQPVEDIPKTYGVNLTGDSGQIWNDMVNPPVSHEVGSTDKTEEEPKTPEPTAQTNQESQEDPKPEQRPELEIPEDKGTEVPEIPKVPELEKPEEKEAEVPELQSPEEKEAEVPEIPKVPELENPEEKEAELPVIPELENREPVPENPDKPAEELPIEHTPEDKEPGLEPGSSEGDIPKPDESEETGDVLPEPKPEDDKKPDIMSELLKSDAFWKWLGEWTATYMELLEKHMRKIAIQEICNREKSDTDVCLLNDQPEDKGIKIKDSKVILDGKEIPVTHTSNFGGRRRGNGNYKDKENNKVDATTIYGNSVGNEKVNNVFIFNAVDAKEVLEELKPGNDSKIDIIIDERGKESKEDELTEEDKIEDKIEIPKESEEIKKPIKEQKEIEDKPSSSELESDKESIEKLPLEE